MYEYLCVIQSQLFLLVSLKMENNNAQNCLFRTCYRLLRGNEKGFAILGVFGVRGISVILVLALISFSIVSVVWSIYAKEKLLLFYDRQISHHSAADNSIAEDLRYAKLTYKQCLLYIFAYVLVNIFPIISLFGSSIRLQPWFQVMQLAIRPLQEFFTLIIVLNHKVYNARRTRSSNMSISAALRAFA